MISILIVTHGHLGKALLESASMLVGETDAVRAVSFLPGQGIEDLEQAVRGAWNELAPRHGLLGLVDIPGGSPARVLGGLAVEDPSLEIVTGVNLAMLIELLLARQHLQVPELVPLALQTGRDSIIDLASALRIETAGGGELGPVD